MYSRTSLEVVPASCAPSSLKQHSRIDEIKDFLDQRLLSCSAPLGTSDTLYGQWMSLKPASAPQDDDRRCRTVVEPKHVFECHEDIKMDFSELNKTFPSSPELLPS